MEKQSVQLGTRPNGRYRTPFAGLPLALILVAFVSLGIAYLWLTPPFEAPDEYGHYAFVRYLAEERRIPPLVVSDNEWDQGQMHQPPLYYTLGALLVGGLDGPDWQAAYPRNPYATLGHPHALGNWNAALHAPTVTPQMQRTATALRLLRGFSLLCSATTVWLTYRLALTLFPDKRWLAVGAAALLALNPQFLFIGASVNNDVLVTTLSAAVLLLAAQVARQGGHAYRTPILLGVLGGLASIAKLSGLASLALVPCAYLLHLGRWRKDRLWPELVRPLLLCCAAAALIGGWWYVRNAQLYGDLTGMRHYTAIFAVGEEPLSLLRTLTVAIEALPSYWGVFGWMNVLAPEAYYVAVRALTVVAGLGLLTRALVAWRRRRWPAAATLRAGAIACLWALIVLILILRWSQTITRTQGRLAFPAAGVLALLLAVGFTAWVPGRFRKAVLLGVSACLLIVAAVMPWAVIAPAYTLPARISADELPADLPRLNLRYGDAITLLAAEVLSPEATPGEEIWVRMYWRAEAPLDQSYTQGMQIVSVGANGTRLGGLDTLPAMGRYPTTYWAPSTVLVDDCALPVAPDADGPLAAAIRVALYAERFDEALPAYDETGAPLGASAEIGRIRIARQTPWDGGNPAYPRSDNLGNRVRLYGYDMTPLSGDDGDLELELALYWECLDPMAESYTVFVHLVGAEDTILSQADAQPLGGGFTTPYWRTGDQLRDAYRLRVPAENAQERLMVRVGLYLPETGKRLPVQGDIWSRDYVEFGPFVLTPEGIVFDAPAQ